MVIAQLKAFCIAAPTLTLHLEGKDGHGRSRTVLESFSVKQEHNDQFLDLMEPW